MIAAFDRFMARHPKLAGICRRKLRVLLGSGTLSNILSVLAAVLAADMLRTVPGGLIGECATAVLFIIWTGALFVGGFLRQWFFLIFTEIYFLIPFGTLTSDAPEAVKRLFGLTSERLSGALIAALGGGDGLYMYIKASIELCCALLFLAGLFIRSRAKRSEFYCKLRIETLD